MSSSLKCTVSVVLPVYNGERAIKGALNSLLNQSLPHIEIIIVNDASTDGTQKVLDRLDFDFESVTVVNLDQNVGAHAARAAGLRVAKGEWIGFLDAGDFPYPDQFATMLHEARQHEADIIVCGVDRISEKGKKVGAQVHFPECRTIESDLLKQFCKMKFGSGVFWNKLYRRDLIMKHGTRSFRRRQDFGEDTLVNLGCFRDAKRVRVLNQVLYNYVIHETSATRSVTNGKAFSRMLSACAEAVYQYGLRDMEMQEQIAELYSRQLSYECYFIEDFQELIEQEMMLQDAVQYLSEEAPLVLSALCNRGFARDKKAPSFRQSLFQLWESQKLCAGAGARALYRRWGKGYV